MELRKFGFGDVTSQISNEIEYNQIKERTYTEIELECLRGFIAGYDSIKQPLKFFRDLSNLICPNARILAIREVLKESTKVE